MSGDDMTKAAVGLRREAHEIGVAVGRHMIEHGQVGRYTNPDPYLQYLYHLGVAQAIANHGRDISGINFGKSDDPQRKGGKA
jgi:hypothetical protein